MGLSFLDRVGGKFKRIFAITQSTGTADAGKIIGTGSDGKINITLMPDGVGVNTTIAPAYEQLSAGDFVNGFSDAGVFKFRLSDNSNGRPADGFVLDAFSPAAAATVYPLSATNSALSSLTVGSLYWLGTAGDVTATPLDETDVANTGKISQFIGKAKSATELLAVEAPPVTL